MEYAIWASIVGALLILMAVTNSLVRRLPLSAAMIYLAVGFAMGPVGLDMLPPNPREHAALLERITEIALLISLFSAGLKLRQPLADTRWRLSMRLAFVGVFVSVAATVPVGLALGLPLGVALLLAVAIAPTDPVLAADVQVENATDRDRLRFSLTGESSLNDGIAFPLIVFALHLIASDAHSGAAPSLWRWLVIDCAWAFSAGAAIGALCGFLIGRLVLYLRTEQKEALGLDEFLVLGLITLAYGIAVIAHASPFLAVFCAGLSVAHTTDHNGDSIPVGRLEKLNELATTPEHAGPLMMRALRGFNEQLERIAEVAIVLLTGALLNDIVVGTVAVVICIYTFAIARPLSVGIALIGSRATKVQRRLMGWFGIRGIGSIYYAFYALNHGLPKPWVDTVMAVVLFTCASSIVVHGISVTPLMNYYRKKSAIR